MHTSIQPDSEYTLPYDVFVNIAQHLTTRELVNISRIDKTFYIYVVSMNLWRDLTERQFREDYERYYRQLPAYLSFFSIYAVESRASNIDYNTALLCEAHQTIDLSANLAFWASVMVASPLLVGGVKKTVNLARTGLKLIGEKTKHVQMLRSLTLISLIRP